MARKKPASEWTLLPSTQQEIEQVRRKCRRLVTRRAAIAAGLSAVSIPGVVIATDLSLFALLIDDIHAEFGLTEEQIVYLRPELKLLAYEAMVGMGGVMMSKMALRESLTQLLKSSRFRLMNHYATKLVPIAGQVISSTLGFTIFRMIGNQHVDACTMAAQAMLAVRAKPP